MVAGTEKHTTRTKQNCRSRLGITGRYSGIIGTGRTSGLLGLHQPLSGLVHPIMYLECNLHLDYSNTKSLRLCVWACEREGLCLCRAVSGMAGLSSRVGGVHHPVEENTLFSFGSWWFGNPKGPSFVLWRWSDAWRCSHLILYGANWIFSGEASFNCYALASIQWQD